MPSSTGIRLFALLTLKAPERSKNGSDWGTFLSHYRGKFLACDFSTVEAALLKTLYVFFVIELGSRRVHRPKGTSWLHAAPDSRVGEPTGSPADLDVTK